MNVIRLRDPAQNKFRFHALTVHGDLLAGWSLLHEWGRIGSPGRVTVIPFPGRDQAQEAADRYEAVKRRKGYAR